MEAEQQKSRVQRNRLQLLDNAAPQFESLAESREQYITALEDTIDLLKREQTLASQNSVAIRNSMNELMAMQQLSNIISTARDPEFIVATLIHLTRQIMPVSESNVYLFDKPTNKFIPLSKKTSDRFNAEANQHVEAGIIDWVIKEQRTVIFPDLESMGPGCEKHIIVIVPLIMRNETLGMYLLRSPKAHEDITNQEIQLLTVLANQAVIGVENWRTLDKLTAVNKELVASQAQIRHVAKLAAIGELASGIVHEIKNPIQILLMHMELVHMGKPLPNWTHLFGQQIKRLSDITGRLMNFSRSVAEETTMTEISVNHAISETLAIVQHEYETNNIEIVQRLLQDLPMITGNVNCLQQVFLNLLINARDAMREGGTITISTESSGFHVVVKITDTGTGIEKKHLDKIFLPFFTTKMEGTGTGLGLSICKKIVTEHKGEIKVESEMARGTTFSIFLPARRRASQS